MIEGVSSPKVYRCVVSIAGVSDLSEMLQDDEILSNQHHFINDYWQSSMRGNSVNNELLSALSPANHADKVDAATLLIHSKLDKVVPFSQSKKMQKALSKASKQVSLVALEGEDHWLNDGATRLQVLRSVDAFLDKFNPVVENPQLSTIQN